MNHDFRCLQRDRSDLGRLTFQLDPRTAAETSVEVVTRAGAVVTATVEVHADGIHVIIPTGGPYAITLSREGGEVARARDVMVGDLWVLAGQSNMQGLGEKDGPVGSEHATMLSFDRTWKPAFEPLHRFWETKDTAQYKMTPLLGFEMTLEDLDRMYPQMHEEDARDPVGGVGPGCFFAAELTAASGVPLGLIPCALGGSSLGMWQRSFAEEHGLAPGDTLFGDLIGRIRLAGGRVTGVLWYQGESDTMPELAGTYLERFTRFVRDVREETGLADLPFITVQLATAEEMDWVGSDNFDLVREAQRQAAEAIPNVDVVAAADLARVDHVHLSREGQRILGERLARAATRYTRGCDVSFTTPRLDSVTRDRERIVVSFADLNGDLEVADGVPLSECFTVEGRSIASAHGHASGKVVLELTDPGDGPVNVSYGTGFVGAVALHDSAGFALPVFASVAATETDRANVTDALQPD